MVTTAKREMLNALRRMLNEVFRLRHEGAAACKLARAQGYVDGYMRILVDAGIAESSELLTLVGEERARVDGPATGLVSQDASVLAA